MIRQSFVRFFLHGVWAIVLIGRANDRLSRTEPVEVQEDYTLTPLPLFGAEVRGINLNGHVPKHLIDRIKKDVTDHQLVVFRDQGVVPAERHVEIVRWFGPPKVTFVKHHAQAHPEVFRVSNARQVGNGFSVRLGWHVDGALPRTMISHSLFHILIISNTSDTWFTSLYKAVEDLPPYLCDRWERLYFMSKSQGNTHHKPLVYSHPLTNKRTLTLYNGQTREFVLDYGTPYQKRTTRKVTNLILDDITRHIERQNGSFVYQHKWQPGDFIMVDNQAVGHMAPSATSNPIERVGLRLLHRASADSLREPVKNYDPTRSCFSPQPGTLEYEGGEEFVNDY